jgi:diacylglycerol kinase (ATP)
LTPTTTIGAVPESPLVIVNPIAGAGRAGRLLGWIEERLRRRPEARLVVTKAAGEAHRTAADAGGTHDRIIAVGGDGTVQEVVNGLLDGGVARAGLGIVPVGSGNDLARSLGLPREAGRAWTIAIGRGEVPTDVARARSGDGRQRWFASAGGIGFDAQVAAAMATRSGWQRGRAGYLLTTLAELKRFRNRSVRITLDDEVIEREVLFVAITNGSYYGGGMKISPSASVHDGLLDLCIVGNVSRLTVIQQLPHLYRGTHTRHPAVETRRGRRVEVEGDAETLVHLDGEPFGTLPVQIEMHGSVLNVAMAVR